MEPGEQGNNKWTLLILEWKLQYQTISNVQGGQGNDIYSADIRMRVHKVRESQEMAYSYKTLIHSADISPRLAVESLAGLWPQEVTKKFIWTTRVSARILYLSVISKPIITRERRPDRATRAYDKYYLLQKTVFEGIWKLKRLKLIFFGILRHHIRNKFIQVWFLANLAPHHLSYRNFLNICRRKKI